MDANERQLHRGPQRIVVPDAPLHEGHTPENPDAEQLLFGVVAPLRGSRSQQAPCYRPLRAAHKLKPPALPENTYYSFLRRATTLNPSRPAPNSQMAAGSGTLVTLSTSMLCPLLISKLTFNPGNGPSIIGDPAISSAISGEPPDKAFPNTSRLRRIEACPPESDPGTATVLTFETCLLPPERSRLCP